MALLYSTFTQTGEQATVSATSGSIASQEYLQLNVPPSNTCPKVKSIQFKCSSHDQGWASDRDYAYSWGDIVIQSKDGAEIYRKTRVFANAVANDNFQDHSGNYDEEDELVKKCTPESKLVLVLNAQFPGWKNIARSAEIQIQY